MDVLNLTKIKKKESISEDTGVGCCNRIITKENTIVCRICGFQSKKVCENCKDKNKF